KNVNLLTNIILGFLSLISPMKYPFQVTSCLPKENYSIIESISPYLFGIKENYSDEFFNNNGLSTSSMTVLCVDLDCNGLADQNKMHLFYPPEEEFPPLPKKLTEKLKLDYAAFIDYYNTSQSEKKSLYTKSEDKNQKEGFSMEEYNSKFQNLFFEYNVNILKGYDRYLNDSYFSIENIGNTNVDTLFKIDDFVYSQPSSDRPFYKRFISESQMFSDFIFKRMIPKNLRDKVEILFINEKMMEITNKNLFFGKAQTLSFLNSKDYDIKNSYAVPRHQYLSENEYNWLIENGHTLLNKGQVIKVSNNPSDVNADGRKKITFSYELFPILNFDLFFSSSNVTDYDTGATFFEDIDNASRELILKAKDNQDNFVEMENYIYLSWLQLWSFAFKFIDQEERQYQFNLMIGVLDKVIYHEMEIFDMLFKALADENEEDMIIRLYKKMMSFKLNPDNFIHQIISGLIDKKSIQDIVAGGKTSRKFIYDNVNKNYRKRTFRISCEKCVLGETVAFTKFYPCVECMEDMDLEKVSTNFTNINRDVNWAFCENCNSYSLPKLSIQVGKELNTEGYDSPECTRTSTVDEVVLHSPHDLKINIKDGIFRDNESLNINKFKLKFGPIFWNSIWYFNLNNLDFQFMLPYEEEIFKFGDTSLGNKVLKEGVGFPKIILLNNNIKKEAEEQAQKELKEKAKKEEEKEEDKKEENKKIEESPTKATELSQTAKDIPEIPERKMVEKEKKFDLTKLKVCHEIERFFISDELYFRFVTKSRPNGFNASSKIADRYNDLKSMTKKEDKTVSENDYYDLENFRARYKLPQMQTEKDDNTFATQNNSDKRADDIITRFQTESYVERKNSSVNLRSKFKLDDKLIGQYEEDTLNNSLIYEDPVDITSRLLEH
ncbi:MAG: hypothetical protein MJ252_22155, partial [archaeon]|nr:hypothetical protein [archaeon]